MKLNYDIKKNVELKSDFKTKESYQINFKNLNFNGHEYFIPRYAIHRPASRSLLNGEYYEPQTHKFVKLFCSRCSGSIIHAGTFFGDMLPSFSESVNGNVYAFEPVLENYVLARLTIETNQLSNVLLFNAALDWDIRNLHINSTQSNGAHAGGSSKIEKIGSICASLTIDALRADDIIIIQLDLEGYELMALKGAEQTIAECRPVIAIEDKNFNCSNFLIDRQYELIKKILGINIWAPIEKIEVKKFILLQEF